MSQVHSICRLCGNRCAILVEVEGGRAVSVVGDREASVYRGHTCRRGRALPEMLNDPARLLQSMRRTPAGDFEPIGAEAAIEDIATKLAEIVDRHGPRSVALYVGTQVVQSPPAHRLARSLMIELGSPMLFSANTIDQPGKHVAAGLHGYWMAPAQGFMAPDVAMWIGINPLVSYSGIPSGVPLDFIAGIHKRGGKTIVIDPRRSETAAAASLHLQIRPGEDVSVLAGVLHILLRDDLIDREFVRENVDGLERLAAAVGAFTPEYVAARAGVTSEDLTTAARWFGRARRGFAVAGTGANMSAARGTLMEYLVLCLDTLCGHYMKAGEEFTAAAPLAAAPNFRAQAWPPVPAYGFGEQLRASGRKDSLAGLQVTDLPAEILHNGEGRVRALINLGGNPVVAWPDQAIAVKALEALDMLVSFDVKMSQTARMSTHVFAARMCLEIPGMQSASSATVGYGNSYGGYAEPWAQYTPAVVEPPPGSDLVEEWEVFYELGKRLGLSLSWEAPMPFRMGPPMPGHVWPKVDMMTRPTTDGLIESWTVGARVPLDEVKKHPSGAVFPPEAPIRVAPKEEGWQGRLDVGATEMIDDLQRVRAEPLPTAAANEFKLLNRRGIEVNSNYHIAAVNRGRFYNPLFMHRDDAGRLGLENGARVEISAGASRIEAILQFDATVAPGTVSMQHCFGDAPSNTADVTQIGSPINRLLSVNLPRDPYTGQPLMSNIAVQIRPLARAATRGRSPN